MNGRENDPEQQDQDLEQPDQDSEPTLNAPDDAAPKGFAGDSEKGDD